MPSSRGSEMSQRQSPRAPLHLKVTACSEANGVHRHTVDRSPKLEDRRSPRSPLHENKKGTRVADLETKFRRAQEELKKLREQLTSTEFAKKEAQEALEEAKKRIPSVIITSSQSSDEEKPPPPPPLLKEETEITSLCLDSLEKSEQKVEKELPEPRSEEESINSSATYVFEVFSPAPVPAEPNNTDNEVGNDNEKAVKEQEEEEETKAMNDKDGETEMTATEKKELDEEENKPMEIAEIPEVLELKAKLSEKEKELENALAENENLMKKAEEVSKNVMTAARAKEEELGVKLVSVEEELRESQAKVERQGEQLGALEEARAAMEKEMKRLRVQTEQWRKAAEAAAAVLGPGTEMMGGRRMAERCRSMDKHLGAGGGGLAGWGSPLMGGEMDEECIGGGKRRGSGIRMFGDLWKKKGHQK